MQACRARTQFHFSPSVINSWPLLALHSFSFTHFVDANWHHAIAVLMRNLSIMSYFNKILTVGLVCGLNLKSQRCEKYWRVPTKMKVEFDCLSVLTTQALGYTVLSIDKRSSKVYSGMDMVANGVSFNFSFTFWSRTAQVLLGEVDRVSVY